METHQSDQWRPTSAALTADDLQSCRVVVVHYWATWDLTDRKMDAVLDPLRAEFGDRICFRSYDIDLPDDQGFVRDIGNIPALGCFIGGKWVESVIGMRSADVCRQKFNGWLELADGKTPTPKWFTRFWSALFGA